MRSLFYKLNFIYRSFFILCLIFLTFFFFPDNAFAKPKYSRKIKFWHHFNQPNELKLLKKYISKFNKIYPDIKVESLSFEFYPFKKALLDNLGTNKSPDVFIAPNDWLGEFVEKGFLNNLNFIQYDYNKTIDICKKQSMVNNSYFGIPFVSESIGLFYNRKLVQVPPKTLDELIESLKIMKLKKIIPLACDVSSAYYLIPWYFGFGGKLNINSTSMNIDKTVFLETCNYFLNLNYKQQLIFPIEKFDYKKMINLFSSGQIAYMINGPWCLGDFSAGQVDFGITNLPYVSKTKSFIAPFIGTQMFCVSAKTNIDNVVKDLLLTLSQKDMQIEFSKKSGRAPALQSAYEGLDKNKDWILLSFYNQIPKGKTMPSASSMEILWKTISSDNLITIFNKKVTPEKFVENFKEFFK